MIIFEQCENKQIYFSNFKFFIFYKNKINFTLYYVFVTFVFKKHVILENIYESSNRL